jgi:WhiB family redox-sensing transcriptional regulator
MHAYTQRFDDVIDWRELAVCTEVDPDLFFPTGARNSVVYGLEVAVAKGVCAKCPVIAECREWACGDDGLADGIAGGLTEEERRAERARAGKDPLRRKSLWQVCAPRTRGEIAAAVLDAIRRGASPSGAAARYGVSVRSAQRLAQKWAAELAAADGEAS